MGVIANDLLYDTAAGDALGRLRLDEDVISRRKGHDFLSSTVRIRGYLARRGLASHGAHAGGHIDLFSGPAGRLRKSLVRSPISQSGQVAYL
jgi:hypothetical protein